MSVSKTLRAAFTFACFYVGGAVVAWTVLPVLALTARDEITRIRRCQRMVTWGFRTTLGLLRWFRIFDFDPDRVEVVRPESPCILVANHPTTIDVVAVLAVHREAVVVIKHKIWNDFFLRGLFRWLGHVYGGDGTLAKNLDVVGAVETRLRQGFSVVIFPEGTRSPAGGLAPMAKGAFAVATRTGCDIVPLVIRCDPPVLHRDAPWHEFPAGPVRYRIEAHAPVRTAGRSTRNVQREIEEVHRRALGLAETATREGLAGVSPG